MRTGVRLAAEAVDRAPEDSEELRRVPVPGGDALVRGDRLRIPRLTGAV
jgi:hypothetical protein